MKAISIRQPWAWAFLHGKPVENRDWRYAPKYRGPVLIHASKKFDYDGYEWLDAHCELLDLPCYSFPDVQDFFLRGSGYGTGGIVAIGRLVDVVTALDSPWFFGPQGLIIKDVEPLDFMPMNGRLGLFDVDYIHTPGGKL